MEYRKFGYDKGGNNKDLCCITLYDKETNKTWNYYRETDIVKQKDTRIAELKKQLANAKDIAIKEFSKQIYNELNLGIDLFEFYNRPKTYKANEYWLYEFIKKLESLYVLLNISDKDKEIGGGGRKK